MGDSFNLSDHEMDSWKMMICWDILNRSLLITWDDYTKLVEFDLRIVFRMNSSHVGLINFKNGK